MQLTLQKRSSLQELLAQIRAPMFPLAVNLFLFLAFCVRLSNDSPHNTQRGPVAALPRGWMDSVCRGAVQCVCVARRRPVHGSRFREVFLRYPKLRHSDALPVAIDGSSMNYGLGPYI